MPSLFAYLLAVQTPLISLEYDKSLSANVKTGTLDVLDSVRVSFVLVSRHDFLHLLRGDLSGCVSAFSALMIDCLMQMHNRPIGVVGLLGDS